MDNPENAVIEECTSEVNPFDFLNELLQRYSHDNHSSFPMMNGGAVGFLSYELRAYLESFQIQAFDDLESPQLAFGFFDSVAVYDSDKNEYVVSASECQPGREAAADRLAQMVRRIERANSDCLLSGEPFASSLDAISPHVPKSFNSNFSASEYVQAVNRAKEYIRAGDIFQVNLSQRFMVPVKSDSRRLYQAVRHTSPAPFAAYLQTHNLDLISASPERFFSILNGVVETRPIKGTRPRGRTPEEDMSFAHELRASAKDASENVMIVDVQRNDLGRVCKTGSVSVPELLVLESYSHVHHLVSSVTGILRDGVGVTELLKATFPGGSITGAPKIRAMEIIDELETVARGPYTGSIGYVDFNGNADFNIIIRTLVKKDTSAYLSVGGGVVADSDPEHEYKETLHKAAGIFRAVEIAEVLA